MVDDHIGAATVRRVSTPEAAKRRLRQRLSAARAAVPAEVHDAEAAALAAAPLEHCLDRAGGPAAPRADPAGAAADHPPATVCAYWPVGSEPGGPELVNGLRRRGWRVLLPVVDRPRAAATALDWSEYTGQAALRSGPLGLREPAGPRLGAAAIAAADLVLVPALAVDHRGVRLGRGGGYYDRTLPLATPGTPLVAVVRDDEVLAQLPAEPHDVRVTAILTPSGLRLVSG